MDASRTIGTPDGVARLSPRQRQCLRLVYRRRTSKEIAIELGIDRSTVDNYIADATRLLGARNRRDAAERLDAAEDASDIAESPPSIIEDHPSRVDPAPAAPPPVGRPGPGIYRSRLPFRFRGAAHNELVTLERLAWIPLLGLAFATGFGLLAIGLHVLGELLLRFLHR